MKMNRVIIYGIGTEGKIVVESLSPRENELNIEIIALMDKQKIEGHFDYPLFTPDKLVSMEYDYILVTSKKWYNDIKNELIVDYDVPHQKVIMWNKLLSSFGKYYCNICGNRMPFVLKFGYESPIFTKKKIIGSGVREASKCPFCDSIDRNRWVQYVLENEMDIYSNPRKILHFAPEQGIEKRLREVEGAEYITADIAEGRADVVTDITNIIFSDNYFDFIICNHVLEHIKNEAKAFFELRRSIKENGKIIFSVPICWEEKTTEDESIDTSEKRLLVYGQMDHVRLYGFDLKEKLEKYGFKVTIYRVNERLSQKEIEEMCLIPEDTVFILEK